MNADKIKAIAEGMGLEFDCVPIQYGTAIKFWVERGAKSESFEPDTNWGHTGMVLEWLHEKGYEITIDNEQVMITYWKPISDLGSECDCIVLTDGNGTLQEAICEAALKVIKGE